MDLLPVELEKALKRCERAERSEGAFNILDSDPHEEEAVYTLAGLGYLKGESGGSITFTLTPAGRSYFADKRRDTRMRWAPVLASAAIGALGAIGGATIALLLG